MKLISTISFLFIGLISFGQTILFVDDNDNITDNSDTVTIALEATNYSTFDYYNIVDNGANPDITYLSNYDVVIWYASTDGVGLGFWEDGTTGDADLIAYLQGGGRLWVIGADLLYAGGYFTPQTFATGDFAFDYMGLESYNVQSYGDDGSLGAPEVSLVAGAPDFTTTSIDWIFSTAWWIDGVTGVAGSTDLYEMGPSSYALAGEVSMLHYKSNETNVLSTYFDPALISSNALLQTFLEESIFYLLNFDLGIDEQENDQFVVYPNPVQEMVYIGGDVSKDLSFTLTNASGQIIASNAGTSIDVSDLNSGIYFVHITSENGVVTKKFVKN